MFASVPHLITKFHACSSRQESFRPSPARMDRIQAVIKDADPFASWWPIVIAVLVGFVMTIRTIMGGRRCPSSYQIDKQIVIVTGGASGIGLEIVRALVQRGGHVIVACKDIEQAEKTIGIARREIQCKDAIKEPRIEIRCLDLRSFDSVRRFVRDFVRAYDRLDVLINNAGMIFHPDDKTVDGFEVHLQVNYMAPFLLTHLLLPHLKRSEHGGRVINVSAHAHMSGKIALEDPLNVGSWSPKLHPRDAFTHSKLAVILATRHLAKELKGTSITANVCTPGLVRGTGHLKRSPIMSAICVRAITYPWMWLLMKNPFEGAQCAIYLATDPQFKQTSGEYFNDCEKAEISEQARNDALAERLYRETMKALKLEQIH